MIPTYEHTDPNWEPILAQLPESEVGNWMWMTRAVLGDQVIEQYKHRDTRRYLNIDHSGAVFGVEYRGADEMPDIRSIGSFAEAYAAAAGAFAIPLGRSPTGRCLVWSRSLSSDGIRGVDASAVRDRPGWRRRGWPWCGALREVLLAVRSMCGWADEVPSTSARGAPHPVLLDSYTRLACFGC